MANRIYFSPTAFRISKPGYDAITETNINNLIVDSTYPGLGLYTTGTITIAGGNRTTVFYTNPTGQIPFVMVQANRGTDAVGGGVVRYTNTTSYIEDTTPPSRVYSTTPVSGQCYGVDVSASTDRLSIYNADTVTRTMRYAIFYPAQGGTTGGSYDQTPDALNWTNFSGTASSVTAFGGNSQTIAGLGGPITLRIRSSVTLTANQSIRIKVNAGYAATISNGMSSTNITVQNGDVISFSYLGSAGYNSTVFVDNISTGTNGIDSFVITATAAPDVTLENNWPNINVSMNSGGNSYVSGTSTQVIGNINTTVNLTVTTNRPIAIDENLIALVNGSQHALISWQQTSMSFNVTNGQTLTFSHNKYAGSAALTFTIYNNTGSQLVDTVSSTLNDTWTAPPDYTPDPININDMYGESYYNQNLNFVSNTVLIGGVNQQLSLRFHLAGNTPSDVTLSVERNGSNAATIFPGQIQVDFTVVNGDTLRIRLQKTAVGQYTGTGLITSLNTGQTLDTWSMVGTKYSGAPP